MKCFLSTILLLNTILLCTTAANAFSEKDASRRHNLPDFDAISFQLGIDSYQTNELKVLMQQHHADMQAAHQQSQSQRQNIHNTRQAHREDLLNILSYEQLYKLDEYMRQNHPRPPRPAGLNRGAPKNRP